MHFFLRKKIKKEERCFERSKFFTVKFMQEDSVSSDLMSPVGASVKNRLPAYSLWIRVRSHFWETTQMFTGKVAD